jgi:signal transduction histidine kinase
LPEAAPFPLRHAARSVAILAGFAMAVLVGVLAVTLVRTIAVARKNARWVGWTETFSAQLRPTILVVQALESSDPLPVSPPAPATLMELRQLSATLHQAARDLPPSPIPSSAIEAASKQLALLAGQAAAELDQVIALAAQDKTAEAATRLAALRNGRALAQLGPAIEHLITERQESWTHRVAKLDKSLRFDFWIAIGASELALVLLAILCIALIRPGGQGRGARSESTPSPALPDRLPDRLLNIVGHDLRQPLQAMGLFLAALEHQAAGPVPAPVLAGLRSAASSMERMVGGLLDIARLDACRITPRPEHFELAALLDPIRDEMTAWAEEKGLELRVPPASEKIYTDPVLLDCILRNLVVNAIKYTEAGYVAVTVRAGEERLAIAVEDTGPGIAEAEIGQIFDEFYRCAGARGSADGLGLGLAVVRRMAALLGVTIKVGSQPGRGSVFSVEIPRASHIVLVASRPEDMAGSASLSRHGRAQGGISGALPPFGWGRPFT